MRLSPAPNQPEHDLVYTPHPLAKQIIDHYKPFGRILDPCCGNGAFYDQLPPHDGKGEYGHLWCEIEKGIDFFNFCGNVNFVISNPPWSKIRTFLQHSYKIADNIVYLITINHIMTKARLREMYAAGFGIAEIYGVKTPKEKWPQSGFQLAAIHIQRGYSGSIIMNGQFGD